MLYLKSMTGFTSHELQCTLQNRTRISKRLFPFPFPLFFFLVNHHYVQNFSHLRRHFSFLFSLSAIKTQVFWATQLFVSFFRKPKRNLTKGQCRFCNASDFRPVRVYRRINNAKQEWKVRLGFVREVRKRCDQTCVEEEERIWMYVGTMNAYVVTFPRRIATLKPPRVSFKTRFFLLSFVRDKGKR